jgi:hypothetical protein
MDQIEASLRELCETIRSVEGYDKANERAA